MNVTLTDHQNDAVDQAVAWFKEAGRHSFDDVSMLGRGQDCSFAGPAGSGKTTVVPAVIEKMGLQPSDVAFCAPTGKASLVMGKKLRNFGMNISPTTIHKLIYMPRSSKADSIQASIDGVNNQIISVRAGDQSYIYYKEGKLSVVDAETTLKDLKRQLMRLMDNDDTTRCGKKEND